MSSPTRVAIVTGAAKGVGDAVAHRWADRVAEELGAPTVLVNNAGITRDNLRFKMTSNDWDAVMGVHLRGAFLMSRAVQSHMITAGWGRVVNMSSASGQGNRGQADYSAAKAGIEGLTKTLAIELGRFGITVNVVPPGFIATDILEATAARLGVSYEDFLAAGAAQIPVNRTGTAEDPAHAVSLFVSEGASHVSGQVLFVAGGSFG